MTPPAVARRAYGGIVKHPLSGKVEFAGRQDLAIEVAKVLDELDPVTSQYVYEMWSATPPALRYQAEWVMPTWVQNNIRQLDGTRNYFWGPFPMDTEFHLFGRPVHIDEEVEGLTFRVGVDA